VTDGGMGEAPTWYRVVKAAKYLGVPPWELAQQPMAWVRMAEESQSAEAHAEAVRRKNQGH
ncbi:MAG: hypothetical protein ABGW82_00600, partial [Paracoccus sp. (in: a-proteobacteria)]